VQDIDFLVDFVVGNSKNLQKLGLEGKISWAFTIHSHSQNCKSSILKMWKIRMCSH